MLVLIACFAALGGFLFGYDLGLIAGALLYMEDDIGLTDDKEAVIVGMAKLGRGIHSSTSLLNLSAFSVGQKWLELS